MWVTEFGYEKTKASVEESLRKLKTDYLDLVLIHQCLSDYYGAYHALESLYDEGKIRAIGVSNFSAERMADIATFNRIAPAVNNIGHFAYTITQDVSDAVIEDWERADGILSFVNYSAHLN